MCTLKYACVYNLGGGMEKKNKHVSPHSREEEEEEEKTTLFLPPI